MTKIFKRLARHWAACLAVAALLIVQAYCDLSLPDYTSKIVDVGIQQGGIESPVPYTVRDTTLQALELLMTEDEAALAPSGTASLTPTVCVIFLRMPTLLRRSWNPLSPHPMWCCTWLRPKMLPGSPAVPRR